MARPWWWWRVEKPVNHEWTRINTHKRERIVMAIRLTCSVNALRSFAPVRAVATPVAGSLVMKLETP